MILIWVLIILYCLSLLVIFGYSLLQAGLALKYLKAKRKALVESAPLTEFPTVTIQLPIFNEKYVVEGLLDQVGKMDYPNDRLEIQVLDDSTDETTEILEQKVAQLKEHGLNITLIHRTNREGFKAGALKEGLEKASGEFIAIFDADFLPDPDFLNKTLPEFQDAQVGVVQTRWEHINRNYSLLTKLQAFALDAHFSVEQVGRNVSGHFINFNGTGGIWRKSTIIDGGGWSNDTLTEDLDLSYRSQLKGWKFVYRQDIGSPAELPIAMSALKSQQFRWTKGGAETFKKMFGKLLFSKGIRLTDRIHGLAHLFNSSVFVFVLLLAIISVPMVFLVKDHPNLVVVLNYTSIFFVSTGFLTFYYYVSYREKHKSQIVHVLSFLGRFIQFLTVTMGLSYYNTQAVMLAYFGKKTPFVRTPKFNLASQIKDWKNNSYLVSKIKFSTIVEGILSLFFITAIIFESYFGMYGMVVFHVLLAIGFGLVFSYTITEKFRK